MSLPLLSAVLELVLLSLPLLSAVLELVLLSLPLLSAVLELVLLSLPLLSAVLVLPSAEVVLPLAVLAVLPSPLTPAESAIDNGDGTASTAQALPAKPNARTILAARIFLEN
ncbi:hypothetical protein [Nitrosomonas eutropha]|uniref:hypothetical protein n=1 Tax=Nitrosomonas eutropha TaxID=916 RepID=UPI001C42F040|nr:hypothetical protein [Nitrosomonas eutropha]